ncbi:DNA mismatch repair protein msh6 [Phlyctochytrium planicorne]|nr:DNA mismatch repair protein msh6 [Phlyctochytrium planicorne]
MAGSGIPPPGGAPGMPPGPGMPGMPPAGPGPVDSLGGQMGQMNIAAGPPSFRPASTTQRSKRVYASGDASGAPSGSPGMPSPPSNNFPAAGQPAPGFRPAAPGGGIQPAGPQPGQPFGMPPQPGSVMQPQPPQFGNQPPSGFSNPPGNTMGQPGVGGPFGSPAPPFAPQGSPYGAPSPNAPIQNKGPAGQYGGNPGQFGGNVRPQQPQPQRPRIDPNQIPSPLAVQEADQATHETAPYSTLSRTMPPLASTKFTAIDEGNCNPRFMRFTTYQVPCTEDLLKSSVLPLGVIIQPLAELEPHEAPVKVVDFGEAGPVRCRRCRGYVNPFFRFIDGGRKFICNLCSIENDVPPEYFCNLDLTHRRRDIDERPELLHGAIEFVASKEYSLRDAKPAAYVFALDVSWNAMQWGVLARSIATLKELIFSEKFPKNARVGIVTFDRSVHFYNLKANLESPQMLVVSDINDVFVPIHDGFLVNPAESRQVITSLLDSLPVLFEANRIGEPVLGAVLQVLHLALKDCGGKVFVTQTSIPSFGPGALKMREDARLLGSDKERTLYEPQSDFWKKLAQDLSQAGICVDLFLFPNAYIDVASVGTVAVLTGGETYYYQNFEAGRDGIKFGEDLKRAAIRPFGYEALLRIRCSNGLKATNYYGNFFMKNSTDIELAGIDSLKSIGVELRHDGKLDENVESSIQAALLYTTSAGERRIRVLNYSLLNTTSLGNVFRYGEMDTTLNFLAKAYVSQASTLSLKTMREQLTDRCVKILTSYRKNIASSTAPGQLILPESFKLYPLYSLALLKCKAFRGGPEMSTDNRVHSMRSLRCMSVAESVPFFYPRLLPLHNLTPEVATVDEKGRMRLPTAIRTSFERLDPAGIYVVENGQTMYFWLGRNTPSDALQGLFGVDKLESVDFRLRSLPVLNTPLSNQVRAVINYIIEERPRFMQMQIVRHQLDPYLEVEFANFLTEDQNHDGMTYVDYLCFVHRITAFFKPPPKKDEASHTPAPSKHVNDENSNASVGKKATDDLMEEDSDIEQQKSHRRKRKPNYVFSDDDEDGDVDGLIPDYFPFSSSCEAAKSAKAKKSKRASKDDDTDYVPSDAESDHSEQDDFVVDDDDEEVPEVGKKRKQNDGFQTPAKRRLDQFRTNLESSPASALASSPTHALKSVAGSSPSHSRLMTPSTDKKKARADDFKKRNDDRYSWLVDERDGQMRTPDDPEYDCRTLYIPPSAWKKFTAFETQFWQIKSAHWDTVVFFKKGKFYGLLLAFVAKELNRTELYEKDADIAHQEFDWKLTDRVNMKMCGVPENSFDTWASQFVAKGYKVARVDQVETMIGKEMREKSSGVKKKRYEHVLHEYQHTATADFKICHFDDDAELSILETLLLQIKPKELILEKGCMSPKSLQLLKNTLGSPQMNFFTQGYEFWDHDRTILELQSGGYFGSKSNDNVAFPEPLQAILDKGVSLTALGGLLKLDKDLVSIGNFSMYDPVSSSGTLILDGKTLSNLEIFENANDGSDTGSLFKLLNHCLSPGGKRLLKQWVCHPLRDIGAINERLDAVEDLCQSPAVRDSLAQCLRGLPDMERIISRIHAGTCKVKDFVSVLKGFTTIYKRIDEMKGDVRDFKSAQLKSVIQSGFPKELHEALGFFDSAFDQEESIAGGDIIINEGYDEIYDDANKGVEDIEEQLESYRSDQEKELRTKITFKDIGKDTFQMEVPARVDAPRDWKIMSKTKAVNRYYTSKLESLIRKFLEAKEIRENARKEVKFRIYMKFDESYSGWLSVIKNISVLDCLCSLAHCRNAMGSPVCRPKFVTGSKRVLEFEELRHPCVITDAGKDFIPNDLALGGDSSRIVLLTGPNMGGKSTLLRQSCIAVIMAQIGSFVPASSFTMTPFDRIFTRLGANDNIMSGQSTFMVELSETSRILKEATLQSLVILDELGRGTSTFDGYAIAFSVLRHLVNQTRCLGLFSTHYGMLTNEFADNKIIDCADDVASKFEKTLRLNKIRDVSLHSVKMSRQADFASLWSAKPATVLPVFVTL